jgi:hypothetical protein
MITLVIFLLVPYAIRHQLYALRKENRERRALAWLALDSNRPLMLFNDALDYRESQSGPFAEFFGGEKRLEDLPDRFLRNPVAHVGYCQFYHILLRGQSDA